MNNIDLEIWEKGLIDAFEAKSIPRGSASRVLNWFFRGDKAELRRGMKVIGNRNIGNGRISGLLTATLTDGTEITFRAWGRKIEYYDTASETWLEVGTDILGANAGNEDVALAEYKTTAGDQVWLSSPNSSLFKIMTANPASYTDMYSAVKNFTGCISIISNRLFLWNRLKDKSGIYGSYIDNLKNTAVSAENIGTGNASQKTFSATLAFKAAGAKRTCYAITATDTVETFTDNYDGTLTGDQGGSGTINYTTGAIAITFKTAPAGSQAITCDYQWEDSTDKGIADFSKSATRLAGEGFVFRQDTGGPAKNVLTYNDVQYCFHKKNTWRLDIGADDTDANNRIFRELAGIPNWRAATASGDGIYFVDDSDINNPRFRLLTMDRISSAVIPVSVSENILTLSGYYFDKAVTIEFDRYVIIACRTLGSSQNNRVFFYDKLLKNYTITDYCVSCFAVNNGSLWAGDSLTNNVYCLLSGTDDDDSVIHNYIELNKDNLNTGRLKKLKKLRVQGEVGANQEIRIYASYDNGSFIYLDKIEGTGLYVDRGTPISVGANTVGSKEAGSGDSLTAFNYEKEIPVRSDKFQQIKLKFEAVKIGYASISLCQYRDLRIKEDRLPSKYRE